MKKTRRVAPLGIALGLVLLAAELSLPQAFVAQTVSSPRGTKCANENQPCNFQGPATVYYGVGNSWIARPNSPSGILCANSTFGDPAPNRTKSCFAEVMNPAAEGMKCADENQRCAFIGEAKVYYGAAGSWAVQTARDGVDCNNRVFGDPAPNKSKSCFVTVDYTPVRGTKCSDENRRCQFTGAATVYFGSGAAFFKQGAVGGVDCTTRVFGDPAPGVVKACYVDPAVSTPQGARCSNEGGTCRFQGTATVFYGSGRTWVAQTHTDSVACSNEVFGDPTPNAAKSCFVAADSRNRRR